MRKKQWHGPSIFPARHDCQDFSLVAFVPLTRQSTPPWVDWGSLLLVDSEESHHALQADSLVKTPTDQRGSDGLCTRNQSPLLWHVICLQSCYLAQHSLRCFCMWVCMFIFFLRLFRTNQQSCCKNRPKPLHFSMIISWRAASGSEAAINGSVALRRRVLVSELELDRRGSGERPQ